LESSNKPDVLSVKIVNLQVAEHYKQKPRTMCVYHGEMIPCAFEGILSEEKEKSWVVSPFSNLFFHEYLLIRLVL